MYRPAQTPPEITCLDSCDSTNRWLLAAAEAGAPSGSVVVTHEQTAGRGRRGRCWVADPGKTLTFSLLWSFPLDQAVGDGLSLAVGVGIMNALADQRLGGYRQGFRVGLKWPNDILLRRPDAVMDAKLGGVLIESVLRRQPDGSRDMAVVIGVGLNCLSSSALTDTVTDQAVAALDEAFVAPEQVSPDRLLPILRDALYQVLTTFSETGFATLREPWCAQHLWEGAAVRISEGGHPLLDGTVRGVDVDGALCIATPTGIERVIVGDVSLRKV